MLFVALDTTDLAHARTLATALAPHVAGVKLGLEFNAHGRDGIAEIAAAGVPIFLDLKLHDIPNTVAKSIHALAGLHVTLLTIHAAGGAEMIRRAVAAAAESLPGARIIAVTVLTSLDTTDLASIGVADAPAAQAVRLAQLAQQSGAHGVVCSPHELADIRAACGPDFLTIVPGIRPEGADKGDQKRTLTPQAALAAGASYLVVGRPITEAQDPVAAAQAIVDGFTK